MVAEECRQYMAEMGFKSILEMVGRVDCLETKAAINHWKADGLDLTALLTPANKPSPDTEVTCTIKQDHGLEHALDNQLLELAKPALQNGERVEFELPIVNTNRTVGTILSHHVVKSIGGNHLPEDTIQIHFTGSAGQSFGAFLAQGISMDIEGDANDYVGKGLSGGRISVYPPRQSSFTAEDNFIAGNVCLYGATAGEAFFRGQVSERFCVRNSGANAVVEGVGDHGCEYMTGGRTVILGPTGRNFAAGMSGGVAYVWDQAGDFNLRCNLELVELEQVVAGDDIAELKELIARHHKFTGSAVAEQILEEWDQTLGQFIKVMPTDYKRVLEEQQAKAIAAASS
jgi:glutamate synthase domain-containing protein 3